jgi:hypothetical protein
MENQQTIVRYLGSLLDLVCVYIYYKVLLCDVCACRIPYALSHDYYSNFFFFSSPDVAAAPAALPTHERTDMTADEMFRHHFLFRYRYHLDSFFTCKKKPFNIFNGRQPSTPESVNSFLSFLFLFLVRMYHLSRRLRRWFLTCISTKRCCTDCVLHFSKVLFPPLQKLRRSETLNALLSRRIGEAVTQ